MKSEPKVLSKGQETIIDLYVDTIEETHSVEAIISYTDGLQVEVIERYMNEDSVKENQNDIEFGVVFNERKKAERKIMRLKISALKASEEETLAFDAALAYNDQNTTIPTSAKDQEFKIVDSVTSFRFVLVE